MLSWNSNRRMFTNVFVQKTKTKNILIMHPIPMSHFAAQLSHFLLKVSIKLPRKMFHMLNITVFYIQEHKNLKNSYTFFSDLIHYRFSKFQMCIIVLVCVSRPQAFVYDVCFLSTAHDYTRKISAVFQIQQRHNLTHSPNNFLISHQCFTDSVGVNAGLI